MSSSEFAEWLAYSEIEPFGPEREDRRAGVVAATIANVNRPKGKRTIKSTEFFPPFEERKQAQTWEEQLKIVEMLNQAFGGVDLREKIAE